MPRQEDAFGRIDISRAAVATIANQAVNQCYGVVGMANKNLVNGISNDIGRTIEMSGRGELVPYDSPCKRDLIFAVFRFLDLEFIFQVVLSLFAILFAYDAINGEKERGTLRLTFANPIPRDTYIVGKVLGAVTALVAPLLLPILIGTLQPAPGDLCNHIRMILCNVVETVGD